MKTNRNENHWFFLAKLSPEILELSCHHSSLGLTICYNINSIFKRIIEI